MTVTHPPSASRSPAADEQERHQEDRRIAPLRVAAKPPFVSSYATLPGRTGAAAPAAAAVLSSPPERAAALAGLLDFHRVMMSRVGGATTSDWLRVELSSAQLKLLFWLHAAGPQPMSHVARALGIGMPAATSLVDKLVETGLVTREHSPQDRRLVLVHATEQGDDLATRLREVNENEWRRILEYVPDEHLATIQQAAAVLARAVRQLAADSGQAICPAGTQPDAQPRKSEVRRPQHVAPGAPSEAGW